MSAALSAGVFHLLRADDELPYPYGCWISVCGEAVSTSDLPPSCFPLGDECGPNPLYCRECAREAVRFSAEGDRVSGGLQGVGR